MTERRYLGLVGIIVNKESYDTSFRPNLNELKRKHFYYDPDRPIILHRNDIIYKKGPFWRFRSQEFKDVFNQNILEFLKTENYLIISVVIDKKNHIERYGDFAFHPYHYCLTAIMERYCGWLNYFNKKGDIIAESRGNREDNLLNDAFLEVFKNGTQFRDSNFFTKSLIADNIHFAKKDSNSAGLQIADLLAYPTKQEILIDNNVIDKTSYGFNDSIRKVIKDKYNRNLFTNKIVGYGKVFIK